MAILNVILFFTTYFSIFQTSYSDMVKMCLFYPSESGHARSDPILNQFCPSDHVHTFYGPQNFHPNTSYEQLVDTKPEQSSTPWVENQSLYWHPSIYRVTTNNGQKIYTRVNNLDTSPYYRWDTSEMPETVEFPPGFRMIAFSDQENANEAFMIECCDNSWVGEKCTYSVGANVVFPTQKCDFLGIAFAMPTCWDESKGIGIDDPIGHVAYTLDGNVSGPCPTGYNKRIPQVQLFVRINNYKGGTYELSDGSDVYHVDFMNGWEEGKLQQIIDECVPSGEAGYNPPCACTEFLTRNKNAKGAVCDDEARQYIIDEATDVVNVLPRGTCEGSDIIEKSWDVDPPFQCTNAIVNHDENEDEDNDEDEADNEDEDDGEDEADDEDEDDGEDENGDDEDEDNDEDDCRNKIELLKRLIDFP